MFETKFKALQAALARLDKTKTEVEHERSLIPQLTNERRGLIESGDYKDDKTLKRISDIDTLLQMIPHRIKHLEETISDMSQPLQTLGLDVSAALEEMGKAAEAIIVTRCEQMLVRAGDKETVTLMARVAASQVPLIGKIQELRVNLSNAKYTPLALPGYIDEFIKIRELAERFAATK